MYIITIAPNDLRRGSMIECLSYYHGLPRGLVCIRGLYIAFSEEFVGALSSGFDDCL